MPGWKDAVDESKCENRFVRLIAGARSEAQQARIAVRDAAVDEERLAQEKIGRTLRVDIGDFDAFKRQLHIGKDGTFDGGEEAAHLLANFADISDMRESAAAELRHFGGEEKVGRAANGNSIEASATQADAQSGKDLFFVAQVAVSKKDNVAQVARSFGLSHEVDECGKHFRAAACFEILDETARSSEIVRGSG